MEKFSDRLTRYRQKKSLSQEEMGTLLGVTGKYISVLEREVKQVEAHSTISRLLAILEREANIPTEWDFSDSGAESPFAAGASETWGTGRALLKRARMANAMSPQELAKAVGYSLDIYQAIEDGHSQMSEKMAAKVAKVLGVKKDDLLQGADEPPSNGVSFGTVGATPPIDLPPGSKARYVPLLSMAQCGAMGAYDDTAYDHTGFLEIDPKDRQAFAVKLAGESMMPTLSPGDIATIYPNYQPKNNCLVLARLNEAHGADVMVKLYQSAQDQVTLISYNPLFPPMTYRRDAFSWIYPVARVSKVFLD